MKVICWCIIGKKDCKYCKGKGWVKVKVIGTPCREE